MLRYIPVLLSVILFGLSYYAYFQIWSILNLTDLTLVILCIFHIWYFLTGLSLFQSIFTGPGRIPNEFSIAAIPGYQKVELLEDLEPKYYLLSRTGYCVTCKQDKPHRAHHCKRCKVCVLRYDHHCVFLNNCIGLRNHKSFILFLFYACLSCFLGFLHITWIIFKSEFEWRLIFFDVCAGVGFFLFGGLGLTNLIGICLNATGIERKWGVKDLFDQGVKENFTQIFGDTIMLWVIPTDTSKTDGLKFPMNLKSQKNNNRIHLNKYII